MSKDAATLSNRASMTPTGRKAAAGWRSDLLHATAGDKASRLDNAAETEKRARAVQYAAAAAHSRANCEPGPFNRCCVYVGRELRSLARYVYVPLNFKPWWHFVTNFPF